MIQNNGAMVFNVNRGIRLGAGGGHIKATTSAATFQGVISGPGQLTISGTQIASFDANNTYSGGTHIIGANVDIRGTMGAGTIFIDPASNVIISKRANAFGST